MKTADDARYLAESLVGIGERFGKRTVAWMTDMNAPLGFAVGNWPEVVESIQCLQGADIPDVMEVTYTLAGEMLHLGGVASTPRAGREQARRAIASGAAFEKFVELVEAQGGDTAFLEAPHTRPDAEPAGDVRAADGTEGYVEAIDALALGRTVVRLGAGRTRKEDPVDPTAGLVLCKKPGDAVRGGDVLARLYTRKTEDRPAFVEAVRRAFRVAPTPPARSPLLLGRYARSGWSDPPA
jgi:pyrimidine-nucleoside phosphorylase